jgi:hypothetical protein
MDGYRRIKYSVKEGLVPDKKEIIKRAQKLWAFWGFSMSEEEASQIMLMDPTL